MHFFVFDKFSKIIYETNCNIGVSMSFQRLDWRWKLVTIRGVVGWERCSHTSFWRVPTPFCTSNLTLRCGIQKITLRLRSHRWASNTQICTASQKCTQWNKTIQCGNSCSVGECSLYTNYLVQFFYLVWERRSHISFCKGVGKPLLRKWHSHTSLFSTTPLVTIMVKLHV